MSHTSWTTHYTSLKDRLFLVTGGATGIGANIVYRLAEQGANIGFFDIDHTGATDLIDSCQAAGFPIPRFIQTDVRDLKALDQAITDISDHFKTPLSGLVNNAASDARHTIDDIDGDYWDNALALNLRPHFFASRTAAKFMPDGGSIINMGSVSWRRRRKGMVAYTTSKGAIHALTRTLAQEFGDQHIRVNSVVPGAILTERQQKLWLTPELEAEFLNEQALPFRLIPDDVSAMVLFLLSTDSRGCSGQDFIVDGGIV